MLLWCRKCAAYIERPLRRFLEEVLLYSEAGRSCEGTEYMWKKYRSVISGSSTQYNVAKEVIYARLVNQTFEKLGGSWSLSV